MVPSSVAAVSAGPRASVRDRAASRLAAENGGRWRRAPGSANRFAVEQLSWCLCRSGIVDDTRPVEPTPGADCDTSYLLKLSRGDQRARATVEFSAPSSVASSGWARDALAPYLLEDEPPRRLIVGLDGTVRVPSDVV